MVEELRATHSHPVRMRSFKPDPRPVMLAFPPNAIVIAVKTADFPPEVSAS